MKRIMAIVLLLVMAAVAAAGLLSLAKRGPPPILTAYHRAAGIRHITPIDRQIDDDPCFQFEVSEGRTEAFLVASYVWDRDCTGDYPAEVMHGVWYDGFEERGFVPDVSNVPRYRVIGEHSVNPEFDTELHMDVNEARRRLQIGPTDYPRAETLAIAITFVGRRTEPYRTPSGHLYHMIVVEAVLSGRVLGPVTTCINLPGHERECAPPH